MYIAILNLAEYKYGDGWNFGGNSGGGKGFGCSIRYGDFAGNGRGSGFSLNTSVLLSRYKIF